MAGSELIERTAAIIDRYRPLAPVTAQAHLARLDKRLREPVRVAIVGRVNAGKSTLVNALLGQRVAPTDVSECTRLVTWFRYGSPQRLEVELHDGSVVDRPLDPGGRLPAEVGVPIDQVAALHAYLANDELRSMVLIDTPGLGSIHTEYSAGTEALLAASRDSSAAADRADAVIYLISQVAMADERGVLDTLRDATTDPASAIRTFGLLGRADQLGDGSRDALEVAVELAEHYRGVLRDQLSTVIPVASLLAETARTAALTELDARAVASFAQLPPGQLLKATFSADRFLRAAEDDRVGAGERERLLTALSLYGVQRSIQLSKDGVVGAGPLGRRLGEISGIEAVRANLKALFGEQDHVLKVRSVLAALTRLSYAHPELVRLRDDVEALRIDPVMHPLAEIQAWQMAISGTDPLPTDLHAQFRRLVLPGDVRTKMGMTSGEDPAQVRDAVKAALVRWRTFLNTEATPFQQAIARVALRSYQLIWSELP